MRRHVSVLLGQPKLIPQSFIEIKQGPVFTFSIFRCIYLWRKSDKIVFTEAEPLGRMSMQTGQPSSKVLEKGSVAAMLLGDIFGQNIVFPHRYNLRGCHLSGRSDFSQSNRFTTVGFRRGPSLQKELPPRSGLHLSRGRQHAYDRLSEHSFKLRPQFFIHNRFVLLSVRRSLCLQHHDCFSIAHQRQPVTVDPIGIHFAEFTDVTILLRLIGTESPRRSH